MKMVYICSPLRGDIQKNMQNAVQHSKHAALQGVLPLAPHTIFTQYLDDLIPEQRQKGLEMGLELLARCDELWVYGSLISEGMKAEILYAKEHGMPIKYQEEGISMKRPYIVGYYKQVTTTKESGVKVVPAVMLQFPNGGRQLTTGLISVNPTQDDMKEWKPVERLDSQSLFGMQNSILNAIRADPGLNSHDNRLLIQLLHEQVSDNSFSILQVINDSNMRDYRFRPLNQLPNGLDSVTPDNYELVYTAPFSDSTSLDEIYEEFNINHPGDFTGRSLSVSDIIVFHKNGTDSAFYVDNIGFKELPNFQATIFKELESHSREFLFEKLNQMQLETGARTFIFSNGIEPIVCFPVEAEDYLTPEEKKDAEKLIIEQNQSEQQDSNIEEEQEETAQDFEEDCGMGMTM